MKPVLISIQRPHTDNIKSLLKKIEVRKGKPNQETPFPCYIYETKAKGGCGKVIGEFVCDRIYEIKNLGSNFMIGNDIALTNRTARESCLEFPDLLAYLKDKNGYAWHISDLIIYDKPKELGEFFIKGDCEKYEYCIYCSNFHRGADWLDGSTCDEDCCKEYGIKPITRPPQSWCYVEECSVPKTNQPIDCFSYNCEAAVKDLLEYTRLTSSNITTVNKNYTRHDYKNNNKRQYMKRKYLDDIGAKDRPDQWKSKSHKRNRKWKKERSIYGFDERDTWNLDYTFYCWLYERLRMFLEVNNVDLEAITFLYKGETLTLQQCIDRMLEGLKIAITDDPRFRVIEIDIDAQKQSRDEEKVKEVAEIWALVLSAMWW